jgi:hypothetical protein
MFPLENAPSPVKAPKQAPKVASPDETPISLTSRPPIKTAPPVAAPPVPLGARVQMVRRPLILSYNSFSSKAPGTDSPGAIPRPGTVGTPPAPVAKQQTPVTPIIPAPVSKQPLGVPPPAPVPPPPAKQQSPVTPIISAPVSKQPLAMTPPASSPAPKQQIPLSVPPGGVALAGIPKTPPPASAPTPIPVATGGKNMIFGFYRHIIIITIINIIIIQLFFNYILLL